MYLKHSQLPKPVIYQHTNTYDLILLQDFLRVNANADMLTLSDDGGVQNAFVCAFLSSGKDKEKKTIIQGFRVHSSKEQIRDYLAQNYQGYQYSSSSAIISCIKKDRSKL